MNEYQQLITLCDHWIKEGCKRKQRLSRERLSWCRKWKFSMLLAALLAGFMVTTAILTKAWALLIPTAAFIFCFFQARYYLHVCDKDWTELEELCQDRIDELLEDREEYRRMQKEEHGF